MYLVDVSKGTAAAAEGAGGRGVGVQPPSVREGRRRAVACEYGCVSVTVKYAFVCRSCQDEASPMSTTMGQAVRKAPVTEVDLLTSFSGRGGRDEGRFRRGHCAAVAQLIVSRKT